MKLRFIKREKNRRTRTIVRRKNGTTVPLMVLLQKN
jgi:hypothetical protein